MYCWMMKYAIQHVERQLNVVEQNRARDCSSLFLSTSCRLLNDVHQSFSRLVSRSLVERSNIATGTAAVLEWNFENVLIYGFWALRRECSMPRKRSCFLSILESTFSDFLFFFFDVSELQRQRLQRKEIIITFLCPPFQSSRQNAHMLLNITWMSIQQVATTIQQVPLSFNICWATNVEPRVSLALDVESQFQEMGKTLFCDLRVLY